MLRIVMLLHGAILTLQCCHKFDNFIFFLYSKFDNFFLPLVQNQKLVLLACKWHHVYLITKTIIIILNIIWFTEHTKSQIRTQISLNLFLSINKKTRGYFILILIKAKAWFIDCNQSLCFFVHTNRIKTNQATLTKKN
jgi:hypothetical protein